MSSSALLDRLAAALPPGELVTDPDILLAYATDQARLCASGRAAALVRARSVDTVVRTLQVAHALGVPVVPRGAGTGLAGGANALDGCIVLSLEKMDRLLELDPAAKLARVEAGMLNAAVDQAARAHGLRYAPDPASRAISTIGGNVATNAGGACCLKYGVTGDHVLHLRAVLADGTVIEAGGRTRKDVAGLDLKRLLVGSEGTLAVVVEVTVRLIPARPACGTLLAFFPTLAETGAAIVALGASERFSTLEVMDQTTLAAVEALRPMGLDTASAALVLAQADTADAADILAWAEAVTRQHGASQCLVTLDPGEGDAFMKVRASALPALEKRGDWLLDDVAVPVPQLPALLALCAEAGRRHGITVGTFGHAGDGNLHPTLVYDGRDPQAVAAARAAFDAILAGAVALGGTVAGEHGIGQLKRGHLALMRGERELALMRGIKAVFDPRGILNPGRGY